MPQRLPARPRERRLRGLRKQRRPDLPRQVGSPVLGRQYAMWICFAILLGLGIVGALIVVARRSRSEGIYVGIVERGLTDHDALQVRAYLDETLVQELPEPSKLTGGCSSARPMGACR
jgi:hypothetical protein